MSMQRRNTSQSLWRAGRSIPGAFSAGRAARSLYNIARAYRRSQANRSMRRRTRAQEQRDEVRTNPAGIVNKTGATTRIASKKGRFKRKRKGKRVKVSNSLRKKVKKVIEAENEKPCGRFTSYARPITILQRLDNMKSVYAYPNYKTSAYPVEAAPPQNSMFGELLTYNVLLNAASVMWNGKAAVEFPFWNNLGNFDSETTVINLEYGRAKYWLKNNSNRTANVTMYKFTYKQPISGSYAPLYYWNREHNHESGAGTVSGFTMTTNGPPAGAGIGGYDTEYKHEPDLYPGCRKRFDVEKIKMVIEPGQTVAQVITFPAAEYDPKKLHVDGIYQDEHKGAIYTAFSVMYDCNLAGNSTATTMVPEYRGEEAITNVGSPGVTLECERFFKIRMPEVAGLELTGAPGAGNYELTNRIERTHYEQWSYGPIGGFVRVDEQQPLS